MWSASVTLTLLSWRPWGHRRSPTTVMTANGEVQTREEATVCVKGLDLFVTVMRRNSRSSFSREALRGSWVYLPLDQRSKTTSHQKGQENWLQNINLCAIRSPWFIYSSTSSTPASSTSSSQDSVFDVNRYTENPVQERSGSTSEELRGKPAA